MLPEERTLLLSVARWCRDASGDLPAAGGVRQHVPHLPAFVPSRLSSEELRDRR